MELNHGEKSIDWPLSIKLANNKVDLAKELLDLLIEDLPKTLEIINQAFQQQDYQTMHQQVHKLHGATCYCGVPKLKTIAATLENKFKKKQQESIKELINNLNQEIQNILTEFQKNDYR